MADNGWSVRSARDREGSPRRLQLVHAARGVFERLGYAATTVADITEAAGVSRATFYVYFSSKEEVFEVLAREVGDAYLEAQRVRREGETDVLGILRRTIGTTLEVEVRYRSFLVVMDHQSIADEAVKQRWDQIQQEVIDRTASFITHARDSGLIDPVTEPEFVTRMGLGLNKSLAPLIADGRLSLETAVARSIEIWKAAIRPVEKRV